MYFAFFLAGLRSKRNRKDRTNEESPGRPPPCRARDGGPATFADRVGAGLKGIRDWFNGLDLMSCLRANLEALSTFDHMTSGFRARRSKPRPFPSAIRTAFPA